MKDFYLSSLGRASTNSPQTQCPASLTEAELSKIRCVGGMCVARVVDTCTDFVCRNIPKETETLTQKKDVISTLNNHTYSTITIAQSESKHPSSRQEICHRQTPYGHLTIVDDELFNIFIHFHNIIKPGLHAKNFKNLDAFENILNEVVTTLLGVVDMYSSLLSLSVMYPILRKYLKTCVTEMGLRIVYQHVQRKFAHRKQVIVEEASGKGEKRTRCDDTTPTLSTSQQPSTSTSSSRNEDTAGACAICHKQWALKSRLLWIECTVGSAWLHKKCDPSS